MDALKTKSALPIVCSNDVSNNKIQRITQHQSIKIHDVEVCKIILLFLLVILLPRYNVIVFNFLYIIIFIIEKIANCILVFALVLLNLKLEKAVKARLG